jgi:hypothetical protein
MTAITFVGANAGVTGNNASLSPTIHASAAAGDTILLFASIRNTAATVVKPVGYEPLLAAGHVGLFWKTHSGSESAPTVTFTGGAAGDDTLAQIAVTRTVKPYLRLGPNLSSNASAQDIVLPAPATPGRAGSLMLALGWKQDDWTSVATLASMTEIADTVFSIAGNDAAQVWDYWIQTTAAASPAGPFVVTGGAAAISKAWILALDQAAAITAVAQDVYPPRVLISVTNLIIGDAVTVYRVVGGVRTALRAGSTASTADVAFLVIDAELPFGVPVSYVAVVSGAEYATSPVTYTLPGGKVALSDAITGEAAEAVIMAWPEKAYTRPSTTFKVGGRNVVVSGDLGQFEGTIELYVETTSSRDNLAQLLTNATEATVQIRQPGGYDGVDSYVAVIGVTERRFSQDGSDQRRILAVQAVEVEGWAPALQAAGFSYADLEAAYTGLTYADLAGDYTTYLDLAQADLS